MTDYVFPPCAVFPTGPLQRDLQRMSSFFPFTEILNNLLETDPLSYPGHTSGLGPRVGTWDCNINRTDHDKNENVQEWGLGA